MRGRRRRDAAGCLRCTYSNVVLYSRSVRRVQIYIDEPLDDALELEAQRRGTSKAALIRLAVADRFPRVPEVDEDPWEVLDGMFDGGEPIDDIDQVIYGDRR
ncbi:MAG: CopG family transcriptional regulator [Chloroflexi bacterium]|nr:MAG: CopG family transcriptional regulator [Chloroflexota bacterium]